MPHAQGFAMLFGDGDDLLSFAGIEREGLLDVDVAASSEGLQREWPVRMRGGRDVDDIGFHFGQHAVEVVVDAGNAEPSGGLLCQVEVHVAHGNDLHRGDLRRLLQMSVRDLATADEGHSQSGGVGLVHSGLL